MPVTDNFQIRQKKARGEFSEIYRYDVIPEKLRNQICFILFEIFDEIEESSSTYNEEKFLFATLRKIKKEMGLIHLYKINDINKNNKEMNLKEITGFLKEETNIELFITVLELLCNEIKYICIEVEKNADKKSYNNIIDSLQEINLRFSQNHIGYQYIFEGEMFVPISNEFLQSNVIQPLFTLLDALEFETTIGYFASAFEKFKERDFSHALVDANSSLESTLKKILKNCALKCDNMKSVPKMLGAILDSELIDKSMKKHILALQNLFTSISEARSEIGAAHGHDTKIDIPESLVECVLNSTASCILFLVKSYQEYMKKQNTD